MARHASISSAGPAGVIVLVALGAACACGADDIADGDAAAIDECAAPLCDAYPPSTLLAAGATAVDFSVRTDVAADCAWSLGADPGYAAMAPFSSGQSTAEHSTSIAGLDPDPKVVNEVYVRCGEDDAYLIHLRYRALPDARPSFPRKGNLWGSWGLETQGLERCARVDLFLGAGFDPDEIRQLRELNPDILVLDSINTVERSDDEPAIPDDYWLKDVNGNRIEVWNGAYRLNLTKPEVAEMQAAYAYQKILDADLAFDGCFFDNFFTSQSWLDADMWGNAVQVDADEDGVADDPDALDAAWREGVFAELSAWRALMPWALASGHLPRPVDADVGALFNGDSLGFIDADTREGKAAFTDFLGMYQGWWERGRAPVITMIEGSPQDQIAYGYGYSPYDVIPASTLEFARTFYPNMRFGLGVSLLSDGYYAYEFGDTWHGNDWWYDELDLDLGQPCAAPTRVPIAGETQTEHVDDGGFDAPIGDPWTYWVDTDAGAFAAIGLDTADFHDGASAARIDIADAGDATSWHVALFQNDIAIEAGVLYDLGFWAKADAPHTVDVNLQKQEADWDDYGLWAEVQLTVDWQRFEVPFEAAVTAADGRLGFNVGTATGAVWIDAVSLVERPSDVYVRELENGVAVVNGTRERQTVDVGDGLSRFEGSQAPRYQYIVDDADAAFSCSGACAEAAYDSGEWVAAAPFFHDWGAGCHELGGASDAATFDLGIEADDTYAIDVWWPAAPDASGWSGQAVFEILSGATVVATATLDQTQGGDEWHRIGEVPLAAADGASVRVTTLEEAPAIADAIYVQSNARYNDGSAAASVTLEPMDAIVLVKDVPGCAP
jgi:hypothetical protein